LVIAFEILIPDSLTADNIQIPIHATFFDVSRLVLFLSIGTVHILLCSVAAFLSISTVLARIPHVEAKRFLTLAIGLPVIVVTATFVVVCSFEPKIYRISYGRVAHVLQQVPAFSYQFDICNRHPWLHTLCPSGNFHIGFFGFILIVVAMFAATAVCADIGVSSFHHAKKLTPQRLYHAGKEMHDDMNRYAVSLLLVVTSGSVSTAAFQPIGMSLLSPNSPSTLLYQRAALSASLFWPFAFTSIILGIFVVPALTIMRKRDEALRLLDAQEISAPDYEGFFAVREALPQSVRWLIMSGIPLIVSLAPRLVGFVG
jgi:hypothetical protein